MAAASFAPMAGAGSRGRHSTAALPAEAARLPDWVAGILGAEDGAFATMGWPLLLRLRLGRGLFDLRGVRAGARGDAGGETVVVGGARVDDDDALVRDDVFADVFA